MAYRYRSRRSAKRLASKSRRNFIITLVIIAVIAYSTLTWILPSFIGGLGFIKDIASPSKKVATETSKNANLAPPVLNIPFEATNTAQINIGGYATPDTKVKLYLDDGAGQTVDVSSDGSFIFENISLSLGTNNIYGTAVDSDSKESLPSKTIKVIFDNEKPALSISEPEDNKKIQGGDKKVKVSGKTDPGIKVFVNGSQLIVDSSGNFSTDQPLNDGDNIITIRAVDSASNSTELQRSVNYAN